MTLQQIKQLRRERNKANEGKPKEFVYNPYASDPIKHCPDLSRSEIDKLMIKMKHDKELKKQRELEKEKQPAVKNSETLPAKQEVSKNVP